MSQATSSMAIRTCVSQQPQVRTGGFCWSKVLLLTCPANGN